MSISQAEASKINGKEPLLAIICALVVGGIAYGIYATLPVEIAKQEKSNKEMVAEIASKKKPQQLKAYKEVYNRLFAKFENSVDEIEFKTESVIMDEIRTAVPSFNLVLVNLSRASNQGSGGDDVSNFAGVQEVKINLTVEGEFKDVLRFMGQYLENGPYQRITDISSSGAAKTTTSKFTLNIVFPTGIKK